MIHHTLLAEWTKLRTTASFWWTTGLVLVISIGWTLLTTWSLVLLSNELGGGAGTGPAGSMMSPDMAVAGFSSFGVLIIMIQAIMVVTTEYRYGLASINFLATPRREQVAVAKVLLYAVIATVLSLITIVLCYLAAILLLPADGAETFTPFTGEAGQRLLWAVPLLVFVLVFLCQGVGLLVRQTAGSIFLVLIWYLVLEGAVSLIPRWGEDIAKVMPFTNMNAVIQGMPAPGTEWDIWISFVIFLVWSLVIWLVGVIALRRRDA